MWIYIFGQLYVFVFILSGRCVDFEPSRNMVTSNFDKNCTTCPEIYKSTDVFKSKYQRKFIFNFSIIVPSKSAFRKITVIIKYQVHVYICVLRNSYNSYVLFFSMHNVLRRLYTIIFRGDSCLKRSIIHVFSNTYKIYNFQ